MQGIYTAEKEVSAGELRAQQVLQDRVIVVHVCRHHGHGRAPEKRLDFRHRHKDDGLHNLRLEEEGVAAAENIIGGKTTVNHDTIPSVIYTWPELSSVGKTEEQLKEAKIAYKIGKFPFIANSRARTMGETEGMVKILAHEKTDRILGVHIVGPRASDMIAEAVAWVEMQASAEDVARTCHAHPTLSEAFKEAAMAVEKKAIHI